LVRRFRRLLVQKALGDPRALAMLSPVISTRPGLQSSYG
jgi:hypothetical protein